MKFDGLTIGLIVAAIVLGLAWWGKRASRVKKQKKPL
jgi:hypothetical protein